MSKGLSLEQIELLFHKEGGGYDRIEEDENHVLLQHTGTGSTRK